MTSSAAGEGAGGGIVQGSLEGRVGVLREVIGGDRGVSKAVHPAVRSAAVFEAVNFAGGVGVPAGEGVPFASGMALDGVYELEKVRHVAFTKYGFGGISLAAVVEAQEGKKCARGCFSDPTVTNCHGREGFAAGQIRGGSGRTAVALFHNVCCLFHRYVPSRRFRAGSGSRRDDCTKVLRPG